jgi:hypothetical protein
VRAGLPPTDGAPGTSDLDDLSWQRGAPSTVDPGAAGLPMADPGATARVWLPTADPGKGATPLLWPPLLRREDK